MFKLSDLRTVVICLATMFVANHFGLLLILAYFACGLYSIYIQQTKEGNLKNTAVLIFVPFVWPLGFLFEPELFISQFFGWIPKVKVPKFSFRSPVTKSE